MNTSPPVTQHNIHKQVSFKRIIFFFLKKIWYLGAPIFLSLFFLSFFFASSKESLNLLLVGMNGWSVKSLLLMKLEVEDLLIMEVSEIFSLPFSKLLLLFIELAWRKMINYICKMSIYYLNEMSFTILTFF